jgi:hypothetical protein
MWLYSTRYNLNKMKLVLGCEWKFNSIHRNDFCKKLLLNVLSFYRNEGFVEYFQLKCWCFYDLFLISISWRAQINSFLNPEPFNFIPIVRSALPQSNDILLGSWLVPFQWIAYGDKGVVDEFHGGGKCPEPASTKWLSRIQEVAVRNGHPPADDDKLCREWREVHCQSQIQLLWGKRKYNEIENLYVVVGVTQP